MKSGSNRGPEHAQDSVKTAISFMKNGTDRDLDHVLNSVKTAISLMKSGSDRDPDHALTTLPKWTPLSQKKSALQIAREVVFQVPGTY